MYNTLAYIGVEFISLPPHKITKILLKVALNTINQTKPSFNSLPPSKNTYFVFFVVIKKITCYVVIKRFVPAVQCLQAVPFVKVSDIDGCDVVPVNCDEDLSFVCPVSMLSSSCQYTIICIICL